MSDRLATETYEQARSDAVMFRLLGAPARSAAAWLSAIDKAERAGEPCPDWATLERIAPSLPMEPVATPEPVEGEKPMTYERTRQLSTKAGYQAWKANPEPPCTECGGGKGLGHTTDCPAVAGDRDAGDADDIVDSDGRLAPRGLR